MTFTYKDRAELERARSRVVDLELKEVEAVNAVSGVLINAGLRLAHESTSWTDVVRHADAIRDALEPFDSGIREAPNGT